MRASNCRCEKTICHCCAGGCGGLWNACECAAKAAALERHRWELVALALHRLAMGQPTLEVLTELKTFNASTLRRG